MFDDETVQPKPEEILAEAHVRLAALEAWVFTLGLAVSANVRADGVTPANNALMLADYAQKSFGFRDDGGFGSAVLERIGDFGQMLAKAAQHHAHPSPGGGFDGQPN